MIFKPKGAAVCVDTGVTHLFQLNFPIMPYQRASRHNSRTLELAHQKVYGHLCLDKCLWGRKLFFPLHLPSWNPLKTAEHSHGALHDWQNEGRENESVITHSWSTSNMSWFFLHNACWNMKSYNTVLNNSEFLQIRYLMFHMKVNHLQSFNQVLFSIIRPD